MVAGRVAAPRVPREPWAGRPSGPCFSQVVDGAIAVVWTYIFSEWGWTPYKARSFEPSAPSACAEQGVSCAAVCVKTHRGQEETYVVWPGHVCLGDLVDTWYWEQ